MIKFSVIIAVYNEEQTIKDCVNSILQQDHPDYELIIINDGSTDKTKEILDQYKNNHRIITIHKSINKDKPLRINQAIQAAKGNIIVITDADSIVPKNWLSNFDKEFIKDPQASAIGGVYESINKDSYSLAGNLFERIFMDIGLIPNTLPGANSAYKKTDFIKSGGYPLRKWGADSMIDLNMREQGMKTKITTSIVVRTGYPQTLRAVIKRKFFWGGGLASITDKTKFRLNFLLRPLFFSCLVGDLLAMIILYFVNFDVFFILFTIIVLVLLSFIFTILSCSIAWIIKNKKYDYLKALPVMIYLPLLQEFVYVIGFTYVLLGGKLDNAWRQKK